MPRLSEKLKKHVNETASHVIIQALAGTGKTTTLIEGLNYIKGEDTTIEPSEQQREIWNELVGSLLEEDKTFQGTICMTAFNKAIAEELQTRVPLGVDAMTMHSMGYKSVRKAFGKFNINKFKVDDIIEDIVGKPLKELWKKQPLLVKATKRLVSLCKMNLTIKTGADSFSENYDQEVLALAAHYDVEMNGSQSQILDLVPQVLNRCLDINLGMDFDDMIWLPIALDLPVTKYDLLLVDEAQDLNRCQQALAKKAGSRLIFCGDTHQAIYGFAGADAESMNRLEEELSETDRGCVTLPLTVTRRCGKAIVTEAQRIVPGFEAHESNSEGSVISAPFETDGKNLSYRGLVSDGDRILCRVNAPLVSECFKFIQNGQKATILGRDIGKSLVHTINKMKASSLQEMQGKLSDWIDSETVKEQAKKNPNDTKIIMLNDRYNCICCFCEDQATIEDVITRIEKVFTDNKNNPGVMLSSIHKAKGLEANRVFLIEPKGATVPHPMAKSKWQIEQEWNLRYVAITRAIKEIVFVC